MKLLSIVCLAVVVTGGCAVSARVVQPAGPLVLLGRPESGGGGYLGSAVCGACHARVHARWRATGHAGEAAGLLPADRRVTACLRCHVTGYGERSGYRSSDETPDLANVGCEACHGPGADHGRSSHPELVPTLTGGACPPCEINRICRSCHTPEHSAGFDLARDLARIACKP